MKPTLFTFVLSLAALPVLAAAQDQAGLPPETAADPAPATRPAPASEQDPTLAKLKNLKPEDLEKVKKAINDASNFVGGIPVVEDNGKLAGILTNRDLRFEAHLHRPIVEIMTSTNLITAPIGTTLEKAKEIFTSGIDLAKSKNEIKTLRELKNAFQNFLFETDLEED